MSRFISRALSSLMRFEAESVRGALGSCYTSCYVLRSGTIPSIKHQAQQNAQQKVSRGVAASHSHGCNHGWLLSRRSHCATQIQKPSPLTCTSHRTGRALGTRGPWRRTRGASTQFIELQRGHPSACSTHTNACNETPSSDARPPACMHGIRPPASRARRWPFLPP